MSDSKIREAEMAVERAAREIVKHIASICQDDERSWSATAPAMRLRDRLKALDAARAEEPKAEATTLEGYNLSDVAAMREIAREEVRSFFNMAIEAGTFSGLERRIAAIEAASHPAPKCTGCEDRIADNDYHSCVPIEPGSSECAPQRYGRGMTPTTASHAAATYGAGGGIPKAGPEVASAGSSTPPSPERQLASVESAAEARGEARGREKGIREAMGLVEARRNSLWELQALPLAELAGQINSLLTPAPSKEAKRDA